MQYPDYSKYDYSPAIPRKPKKPWGGYRKNAGRKHNWNKADYPLTKTALPSALAERIKLLRDSNITVDEMLFRLDK